MVDLSIGKAMILGIPEVVDVKDALFLVQCGDEPNVPTDEDFFPWPAMARATWLTVSENGEIHTAMAQVIPVISTYI